MGGVTAARLAEILGVSRGRVSQLVSEGKLDGCYAGEGRARRFDVHKCAQALDRKLDLGQRMGNGAGTADAIQRLRAATDMEAVEPGSALPRAADGDADANRYQRARAELAEARALKERLNLAATEGRYVLASEVELSTKRAIAAEIAEMEAFVRQAAERIAVEHELPAAEVKATLRGLWRAHRERRSRSAAEAADQAGYAETERAELEAVTA